MGVHPSVLGVHFPLGFASPVPCHIPPQRLLPEWLKCGLTSLLPLPSVGLYSLCSPLPPRHVTGKHKLYLPCSGLL